MAVMSDTGVKVWDIPTLEVRVGSKTQKVIDPVRFIALLAEQKADAVVLENVWAMPRQGVSSAFSFGRTYGAIESCVRAVYQDAIYVAPNKWKKDFLLDGDKEKTRQRCTVMYPDYADQWKRKKDHNRAEAVLIAAWGRQHYGFDK